MKSLKERLKEREIRLEKKRRKRSVKRISYISIKLPLIFAANEGDKIYLKKRARLLWNLIRNDMDYNFAKEIEIYINEIHENEKTAIEERNARWRRWNEGNIVQVAIPEVVADPLPTTNNNNEHSLLTPRVIPVEPEPFYTDTATSMYNSGEATEVSTESPILQKVLY